MSKRNWLILLGLVALVFILLPFLFNKSTSDSSIKYSDDAKFKDYVSAHTGGYISTNANIRVVLAHAFSNVVVGEEVKENYFQFSPAIEGKTNWVNDRTIEFVPSAPLEKGKIYQASFHLGKLEKVSNDLKEFDFGFKVIPQNFDWDIDQYIVKEDDAVSIKGHLNFIDDAANAEVEKMLLLKDGLGQYKVIWDHKGTREHVFTISEIKKQEAAQTYEIEVDGKSIDIDRVDMKSFSIPGSNERRVLHTKVINEPEQYVSLQYTQALNRGQDLAGFVNVQDGGYVNTSITDNELRIYLPVHINGDHQVSIIEGVKDATGKAFNAYYTSLNFSDLKPKLSVKNSGNILPKGSDLLFPFEAINLKSVIIKVTQVYEQNILQFLQVNELSGQSELRRVGKTVLKKRIKLDANEIVSKDKWNNYSVDLSQLVKAELGAIYHVSLSFDQSDAICNCAADTLNGNVSIEEREIELDEDSEENWEYYGYDYEYDDYYYNDYNQRENECSPAYYYGKSQSRNVLATNIGLIAKKGNDGNIDVYANGIDDIKPLSNVGIEIYDYQGRILSKGVTDGEGHAQVYTKSKPFVLIAKNGDERNYIKLSESNALMLSNFDISGEVIQKGLKGFIYGERGVWRPGDSLFLTFILDDSKKPMPADAPVVFELSNPRGGMVQRMVKSNHTNRFYHFAVPTRQDDITGYYLASVKVGGATFTKNIRIETIMPNRLKIKLDFGKEELKSVDKDLTGNMQVNWLHGSPGRNLNVKTELNLSVAKTEFKNFKDFQFQDDNIYFYSEQKLISDVFTNDSGRTTVSGQIGLPDVVPGKLNANFTVKAFEDGGAYSIDRFSIPYSPFANYVGIKMPAPNKETGYLETDLNHIMKIAVVNENGDLSSSERLHVKLYKLSWRYWWESGGNDYTGYLNSTYYQPTLDTVINTYGNNIVDLAIKIKSSDWGRYLVSVKDEVGGHTMSSQAFFDWPAWAGKSPKGNEGATLLMFNTDKAEYKVGEEIKIKIPSMNGGKALITLENGSRVIEHKWVNTTAGFTNVSLKATENLLPNAYVSVAMIQAHNKWNNDLPLRLYGIQQVTVTDANKKIEPVITSADVWKPNQLAEVQVKEKSGKSMTYTLAVVDEGLLDITRFKTPNPYNTFYAKEALGIKTWDIYDQVIGGFSKGLRRILSIGGDGSGDKDGGNKANRFKPVVRYIGPFTLGKNASQTHKINIPNYIGSVRVMVVAGENGAYGCGEKAVPVRKPLMVLGTLPRVVSVGEEVELPVTVFAMEKKIKQATIKIVSDNHFIPINGNSSNVTFSSIGDKVVPFKFKVNSTTGIAKIKIQASGHGESSEDIIEIDVRQPNEKQNKTQDLILSANQGSSWNYQPLGISGSNQAILEVSTLPPLNLGYRLNYLIEYPHGCIEQTTSPGFAQLHLKDVIDLSADRVKAVEANIKSAITRIKSFQTYSGGLAYWPGGNSESDWGTNYAYHFLLEAQASGYSVPGVLLDNLRKYQQQKANIWKAGSYYVDDYTQAYRLYTLALANKPDLSSMNRLKEYVKLSSQSKWLLSGAYVLAGQKTLALNLINKTPSKINPYVDAEWTYGDNYRDAAIILDVLIQMGDMNKAAMLAKEVSANLSTDTYMGTQSTAYSLVALSKYYAKVGKSTNIDVDIKINSKSIALKTGKPAQSFNIESANSSQLIEIKNKGTGTVYAKLIRRGVPALGSEEAFSSKIACSVVYKNANGIPLDIETLKQGTTFFAEVTITNSGVNKYISQMALSQVFPAGWEIVSGRIDDAPLGKQYSIPEYTDVRDDRVYSYFGIGSGISRTYAVKLQASYRGKFYLPATKAECMYDHTIAAATKGKWVNVVSF
jgi:alpha-2-macroglobulin